MKNFILGLLIGLALGGGIAWAAQGVHLERGNGTEIGTTENPVYVTLN